MSLRTKLLAVLGCAAVVTVLTFVLREGIGTAPVRTEPAPAVGAATDEGVRGPRTADETRQPVPALPDTEAPGAAAIATPGRVPGSRPNGSVSTNGPSLHGYRREGARIELPTEMSEGEQEDLVGRGILSNSTRPLKALRGDPSVLLLRNAIIDTGVLRDEGKMIDIPEDYRASTDTSHHIVQFTDPLSENHRAALEDNGAVIEHYVPNRAYAITADAEAMASITTMAGVNHVEPFHPFFKMSRDVQEYLIGTPDEKTKGRIESGAFKVLLFEEDRDGDALKGFDANVSVREGAGGLLIATLTCDPADLGDLVKSEAVKWVEPVVPRRVMNDLAFLTTRAGSVRQGHPDYDGSGVIVGVVDTGVDHTHRGFADNPDFNTEYHPVPINTRIVYYEARTGPISDSNGERDDLDGHGSHVAGSVLGNGGWSTNVIKMPGSVTNASGGFTTNQFAGMAPKAGLVMLEDFNSFDDDEMTRIMVQYGAVVMNNSWGSSAYDYSVSAAEFDALVRDADSTTGGNQPLAIFFAAGNDGAGDNDGTGGFEGTVGSPGHAKNVVTVGAVEQFRLANNLPDATEETDTDWQVSYFSSRGPTPDGRVKPDIVAPGSYVSSVQSKDVDFDHVVNLETWGRDYRHGNLDSGTNYAVLSGTSMASPLAAGTAALLFQHLTNYLQSAPAPSLIKAILVNTAVELSPWTYEHMATTRSPVYDGWGMVDLFRSIDGPMARQTDEVVFYNEEDAIDGGGEVDTKIFQVGTRHEGSLRVTLAWSDRPGTPGTGKALVNDLDLAVTDPDGTVFHGNQLGQNGWGASTIYLDAFGDRITEYNAGYADHDNNIEVVIIPYTRAGNYEIRVIGNEVPLPSQAYSLAVMKGGGAQGSPSGTDADVAIHADGSPVIAYSAGTDVEPYDTYDDRQVMVRRWHGQFGAGGEFGSWRYLRDKWMWHEPGEWTKEVVSSSILDAQSLEPTVTVNPSNDNVYVAWRQKSWDSNYKDSIYVRYWNGASWGQLGGSAQDMGISWDNDTYDAMGPVIKMGGDGKPIVAYMQSTPTGPFTYSTDIYVKRWTGTAWRHMDGVTVSGKLPLSNTVLGRSQLDMDIDSAGRPVVVWSDGAPTRVACWRWTGAAWAQVGGGNLGSAIQASGGKVSCDDAGGIYVSWVQGANPTLQPISSIQVAYSLGGGLWSALGTSMTYPGVSGTNKTYAPVAADLSVIDTNVFVVWQSGNVDGNHLLSVKWNGSKWTGVGGAHEEPGITRMGSRTALEAVEANAFQAPVAVVRNNRTGAEELMVYGVVGYTGAPIFLGLRSAYGTESNEVVLGWLPVNDPGGAMTYHIFRTPGAGWSAADTNIPPPTDEATIDAVFGNEVATVSDVSGYVVTGLTADTVWYWGVRAENTAGFVDDNRIIRAAGPFNPLGDADGDWLPTYEENRIGTDPVVRDSDSDGMWDGWEWYYSYYNSSNSFVTNTPWHTNAASMDPLDDGDDNLATSNELDGVASRAPLADADGDGYLNIEEFNYWLTKGAGTGTWTEAKMANYTNWWLDPTDTDSDNDTMGDGWEGLNPPLDPGDPADRWLDADGDGLTNWEEHVWDTDPNVQDSDYDGVSDGAEVHVDGTFPRDPDTDGDGLDDGEEKIYNGDPSDPDSNNNDVDDRSELELGYTNLQHTADMVHFVLKEDCQTSSHTNWFQHVSVSLWHRSNTEPSPQGMVSNGIAIDPWHERTTNYAFRFANDMPDGTNVHATYFLGGEELNGWLVSPPMNPGTSGVENLFVSWLEYYETEKDWDICELSASVDGGYNWTAIRPAASGFSEGWVYRVGDLSEFANNSNLVVRFRFRTIFWDQHPINNHFRGWWVDDIKVFGGGRITGNVRDENGAGIRGARVTVLGLDSVTNLVHGHRYVLPGTIFHDVEVEDGTGAYEINGLLRGKYHVKAHANRFRSEFWNGPIYPAGMEYYLAFGLGTNFGVFIKEDVSNGPLDMTADNATAQCDFELGRGANAGRLGVVFTNEARHVYLGQFYTNAMVWNGDTNAGSAAIVPYTTTNGAPGINIPNFYDNPVVPAVMDDVTPGTHVPWLHPGWSDIPAIPVVQVPVRDAESTIVYLSTNQAASRIDVRSDKGGYSVVLDGVDTGEIVLGGDGLVSLDVLEGDHYIGLAPTGSVIKWIAPKLVNAPLAGRGMVSFSAEETDGTQGSARISAVDFGLEPVTGAMVFVNGVLLTSQNVVQGDPFRTPAWVRNMQKGIHKVTVYEEGYRMPAPDGLGVYSGVTSELEFWLPESDRDYDGIGDQTEIEAYTNILLYSGRDDPDGDGINSGDEFLQYLDHDVRMNVFDSDTDGDEMSDSEELGYDTRTNSFGLSTLATNASYVSQTITVYFVGKFLAGESGLFVPDAILPGQTNPVSIDGDQVLVQTGAWVEADFGHPAIRYGIPQFGDDEAIINASYLRGTPVFSDPYPDRVDSDEDGMWDGFEHMFSERTIGVLRTNKFAASPPVIEYGDAGLNPLDAGETLSDPDFDGLGNYNEFLGFDHTENTNDWTRPDDGDTDNDIMPDGWEWEFSLNALDPDDALLDLDMDLLINRDEWLRRTDPTDPDTDVDLITDGAEVFTYGSDPTMLDTDSDGLIDGWEVIDSDGNPLNGLDGGFFPGWEPGNDQDEDGNLDGPTDWDTDGDGMPDGFEVMDAFGRLRDPDFRLDPLNPFDADGDPDGDGLLNLEEYLIQDGRAGLSPDNFLGKTAVLGETGGVLVVEIEATSARSGWIGETNYAGYLGNQYYTYSGGIGDTYTNVPPTSLLPLTYVFHISLPGEYSFQVRHQHASADPAVENICWVSVDGGPWRRTTSPNSVNSWVYDTTQEEADDWFDATPTISVVSNSYSFDGGYHTLQILGGWPENSLDRFQLYASGLTPPGPTAPASPVIAEIGDPTFLWDFPTNPFDADSDGDGLPDGWEAWHGLHPRDPIPVEDGSPPWVVRYPALWLFSDLDNDGVGNRNEYDHRFVLDPAADWKAIPGSLHPWFPDTDEDGLVDGDEIKSQRTNPLNQDTDGDGIADGEAVPVVWSELDTDLDGDEDYDRALNDLWVFSGSVWTQLQADGAVTFTDVFGGSNHVLIEIEHTEFADPTVIPRSHIYPANWAYNASAFPEVVTNLQYLPPASEGVDVLEELLTYRFTITEAGIYQVNIRTYYPSYTADAGEPYDDVSFWFRINDGRWRHCVGDMVPPQHEAAWTWFTKEVRGTELFGPEGELVDVTIPLPVGTHTLQISGSSGGMRFDRIAVYLDEIAWAGEETPGFALTPPSGATAAMRPTGRWGGGAAAVSYLVSDNSVDSPWSGVYVGRLADGNAIEGQTLLSCSEFTLFGGRDGREFYDEIWALKGAGLWFLRASEAELPFAGLTVAAGELVADGFVTNVSERGYGPYGEGRPRPGHVGDDQQYPYYGGGPSVSGNEIIWGPDGVPNMDSSVLITGWDDTYDYKGGLVHDEGEIYYTDVIGIGDVALYAASDDETDIIYRWGVGWDVYQSASNFVTYSSDGEDKVWLGCLGSTTNDRLYTGLVFDEVLNSQYDYVEGYMQAVIELTAAAVNTNAFQIAVMGELERDEDGSSALGLGPPVLQSPGYGSPPPYDRIIRDPSDPEWDINTTIVTSVIPAAAVNEKVFINVTEQVDEMFRAVRDGARHEMGVNLGFVIWGLETTPGLLKFRDQESLLRIEVSRAPWWKPGGLTEEEDVAVPYERKSSATVFDDGNGEFVMFGGIDGVSVLDDTWISGGGDWIQAEPEHRPPARWGHGMAYAGLVIVFGGFGEDNEPLNDLWVWDGEDWSEITVFARDGAFVNEKPPPRGAMAFGSAGGQVVLFGGTDGDRYLNDTWVLETGSVQEPPVDIGDAWRWVMMVPPGEQNDGPMGRAYPFVGSDYVEGMILFGGRVGTLPTATDTDGDWIDDGVEIDLGGPSAGRDPRVNALYDEALVLNPDEKIPYAFKLLGGMELSLGYYRDGAIADFESLAHPEGLWFNGLNLYSYGRYPAEGTYNPPPTPVLPETGWFRTGYQALIPNDPASVDQWWHRFGYTEMTDNPLDEWELGTPFGPGDNTAPPYAYSGRWCYGTDLDGLYENNVVISLYSPFLDLRVPADDSTSEADNTNDWYLVFHEWLDLADEQDAVRVEVIRPNLGEFGEYTADVLKRWSGTEPPREPVLILPERNGAHNTTGEWRRVIVPVNLKEEGIFFAFVLESDGDGTAGGWYIDDVALIQGGKISGNYSGSDVIYLLGADGTNWLRKTTAETGVFTFDLLPAGEYRIATGLGDNFTGNPVGGDGTWHLYIEELAINEILLSISVNSPVHLAWNAIPGANYEIQYTTPELLGSPDPWMTLDTVTATDEIGNYIDWDSEGVHSRLYRILFTGLPWE